MNNPSVSKFFRSDVKSLVNFKLPLWQSMILSVLLVALAVKFQMFIQPTVNSIVFVAMYPVVFFMAWIGGGYIGFFTTLLSVIAARYFFIHPQYEFTAFDTPNVVRMILFIVSNGFVSIMMERLHQSEASLKTLFNKVAESDTHYRAIVELSPHIIWFSNEHGETSYLNQTWEEFSGLNANSSLSTWCHSIHPNDYDKVMGEWNRCLKSLERFEIFMRLKRHDGEYRWFLARGKPVMNSQGKVVQWIGKAVDFHEQKMAFDSKDEFISLASHELKTPLTSLSLQLQILEKNIKNKNEKILSFDGLERFSKISLTQINQITHLIEDMLSVSRIAEGKVPYQISQIDLNELIENATQIVSGQYTDANIPLTVKKADSLTVAADQIKLVQVFVNLLINALKYGNNTPVSIELSKDITANKAKVIVADSGHGISKENHSKIFERFVQINTYGKNAGLGLGLYLSKEIVLAHSGNIFVESETGKGARFVIELPLV